MIDHIVGNFPTDHPVKAVTWDVYGESPDKGTINAEGRGYLGGVLEFAPFNFPVEIGDVSLRSIVVVEDHVIGFEDTNYDGYVYRLGLAGETETIGMLNGGICTGSDGNVYVGHSGGGLYQVTTYDELLDVILPLSGDGPPPQLVERKFWLPFSFNMSAVATDGGDNYLVSSESRNKVCMARGDSVTTLSADNQLQANGTRNANVHYHNSKWYIAYQGTSNLLGVETSDDGLSWTPQAIPDTVNASTLHPPQLGVNGTVMYIGSAGSYVYETLFDGWQEMSAPIDESAENPMFSTFINDRYYHFDGAVWQVSADGGTTWTPLTPDDTIEEMSLSMFPSPFVYNGFTVIRQDSYCYVLDHDAEVMRPFRKTEEETMLLLVPGPKYKEENPSTGLAPVAACVIEINGRLFYPEGPEWGSNGFAAFKTSAPVLTGTDDVVRFHLDAQTRATELELKPTLVVGGPAGIREYELTGDDGGEPDFPFPM